MQPAEVVVNNAFASRAVQTVRRDARNEITTTPGSNKRRPQIQWLPAHVPYVAPHLAAKPRRRTRKARDTELLFLGR